MEHSCNTTELSCNTTEQRCKMTDQRCKSRKQRSADILLCINQLDAGRKCFHCVCSKACHLRGAITQGGSSVQPTACRLPTRGCSEQISILMPVLHVSLAFLRLPDAAFSEFAGQIFASMTGNTAFPSTTPALSALSAATGTYTDALAASPSGGPSATAAKNAARTALAALLRQLAHYVQQNGANDLATLLSSGFKAASTNRATVQLAKPASLVLTNGLSTQLLGKVPPVKNAKSYEGRIQPPTGAAYVVNGGTDSRNLAFNGLTPGLLYTISVRAIGGSTGYSDRSDPTSHICM